MLNRLSQGWRTILAQISHANVAPGLTINEARETDLDAHRGADTRRSSSRASRAALSLDTDLTLDLQSYPAHSSSSLSSRFAIESPCSLDSNVASTSRRPVTLVDDVLDMVFKRLTTCRHMEKYNAAHAAIPFVLSSVCRHWRDVALESALLWSHLYLPCGADRTHNYELYTRLVLQRSRDVPLHVLLFDCDDSSLSVDPNALDLVLEAVSRWRAITISGKAAKWDQWRQILHRETPILEYCFIAGEEPQWEDEHLVQWHPDEEDLELLPNAPNLQNLELSWIPVLCSVVGPPHQRGAGRWLGPGPTPLVSLTCLRLFLLNAEAERVHDLLRALPQLEELCLAVLKLGVNIAQWAAAPGGAYALPELRAMDLRGVAPLVFVPAQGRISAENLEAVTLQPECIHYLALFLASNGNSQRVRSVTVLGGLARLASSTLMHLRMLPALESVVLDTDVADDFFDDLSASAGVHWPRLHTLHIDRGLPSDAVRNSLLRYVETKNGLAQRDDGVAAFQHVCVNEDTWLARELEERLGSRREEMPLDEDE